MNQSLETKAHRLQVEPKFAGDEVAVMSLTFIGPVVHPVIEAVQLIQSCIIC